MLVRASLRMSGVDRRLEGKVARVCRPGLESIVAIVHTGYLAMEKVTNGIEGGTGERTRATRRRSQRIDTRVLNTAGKGADRVCQCASSKAENDIPCGCRHQYSAYRTTVCSLPRHIVVDETEIIRERWPNGCTDVVNAEPPTSSNLSVEEKDNAHTCNGCVIELATCLVGTVVEPVVVVEPVGAVEHVVVVEPIVVVEFNGELKVNVFRHESERRSAEIAPKRGTHTLVPKQFTAVAGQLFLAPVCAVAVV
ncbi:hypothetical protein BDZ89DRAFT_1052064 [Hymenopellis radicata]|nr:hypothetical protein BDZ89DRAFT_1052064 [Hymenopellis radicata]